MNERFLPEDPKLTAYALGELEGDERAEVEARLRDQPEAQALVEEIRATAAQLEAALRSEPLPAVTANVVAPAKRAAGGYGRPQRAKLLRFPQVYYVVGGLLAACFAIVVVVNQPPPRETKAQKYYREVTLPAAMPTVAGDSTGAVMAMPNEGDESEPAAAATGVTPGLLAQVQAEHAAGATQKKALTLGMAKAREERGRQARQQAIFAAALAEPVKTYYYAAPSGRAMADTSGERYAYRAESDFLRTADQPLSTFSIDVDTASYANVRRMILAGQRPPIDAVRIEEMLNYFPYRYAAPAGDAPFAATMEVAEAPWRPEHRLVRIGLKAREVATSQRAVANLVFLLDVSGSMNQPNKLPLVKESLRLLLGKLRSDDRVAIVTYAGASGLALPSTPVSRTREIEAALAELTPAGSTNGAMGIQLAYDIAKANFVAGGINRVILCTDGDFNVGVTSEGDLVRLIEEKAKSGVFLTVLGFGMGNLQDATLQQLADRGNGNYGYVDTRREAEKLLVEQVSGTLVAVAKDVKLQVEFNPAKVSGYRLIGYEKRQLKAEDFNNDAVDAGEIGAGHTVTALYEIVPAGAELPGNPAPAVDELRYALVQEARSSELSAESKSRHSDVSGELLTLKVRYKEPAGEVSRKLEFPLTDRGTGFAAASEDFKFAAAVAGFGMLLRESPHKGNATFATVARWAEAGMSTDVGGYRSEFVELVRRAEALQ